VDVELNLWNVLDETLSFVIDFPREASRGAMVDMVDSCQADFLSSKVLDQLANKNI
jgi:hypothetical protein